MKKEIILLVLLSGVLLCQEVKYFGGIYDGSSAVAMLTASTLNGETVAIAKYQGGNYDGYNQFTSVITNLNGASTELAKYYGGNSDGYAIFVTSLTYLNGTSIDLVKYHGGTADGYAFFSSALTNLNGISIDLIKYYGGSFDGSAMLSTTLTYLDGISIEITKYQGGSNDGHSWTKSDVLFLDGIIAVASAKYQGGNHDGYNLGPPALTYLDGNGMLMAKYYGGNSDGYSSAISFTDISLPVTLALFTLTEVPMQTLVNVQWRTESEIENDYWLLLRKAESDSFTILQKIPGQGNSNCTSHYAYHDYDVEAGQEYTYQLADVSINGRLAFHEEKSISVSVPESFKLFQNYPNPFNPRTTILYSLPEPAKVQLIIYNILGQQVTKLYNQDKKAGYHRIVWDGKNQNGVTVSSGMYIYLMQAKGKIKNKSFRDVKKMVYVK